MEHFKKKVAYSKKKLRMKNSKTRAVETLNSVFSFPEQKEELDVSVLSFAMFFNIIHFFCKFSVFKW